jgi:glutathione S-transferase
MMSFPVQISLIRANVGGMDVSRMKAFLKRMEERPAYKRAVEKGGPIGLDEP